MVVFAWIGFVSSLVLVIIIARKNLPLALLCGTIVLGLFTLPFVELGKAMLGPFLDLSVLILALAVGFIPMIGGVMKDSGQMDNLVNNLRIGKRGIMALAPALMGLLPMPGGALFSAPVLEKAGQGVADDLKVTINIWFRHLLILVYPLSSDLIASVKIANQNLYVTIAHFVPVFIIALILGYVFFIRKIHGSIAYTGAFSLKNLLVPLVIIMVAPVIDFTFKIIPVFTIKETATLLGVIAAFVLSLLLNPVKLDLSRTIVKMKPWNFSLIIIGLFMFLNVFKASKVALLIAAIPLSPLLLCVIAGFIVGVATGRVLLPASVIFPIYLSTRTFTPVTFAIIYVSIYFGYVLSPVHPCVAMTCEYFKSPVKNMIRRLALPTGIIMILILVLTLLLR
ncbi:MAG TPA: DUF401 family protein [bacterium]